MQKLNKIVITSGYFNPLHIGHINLIRGAKNLGDFLIVIVNNDKQVKLKGGVPFMPEQERIEIVKALRYADDVILSVDKDKSVCKSLKKIAEKYSGSKLFFANGGDRHAGNIPETEILKEFGIKTVDNVGGGKIQSSSWLIKKAKNVFSQ